MNGTIKANPPFPKASAQRIAYLDYARAIGIMLVIFGHETTYSREIPLRTIIYLFHMPMFFVLSGITFAVTWEKTKTMPVLRFVKTKTRAILLPALAMEMLMFLCLVVKNGIEPEYAGGGLTRRFLGIFIQIHYTDFMGSLWFFPCIFLADIAMFLLYKFLERNSLMRAACIVGGYTLAYLYSYLSPKWLLGQSNLPWGVDVVPVALLYMFMGILFWKMAGVSKYFKAVWMCAGFPSLWWLVCNGYNYAMDARMFGHVLISPLCAGSMSMLVIWACKMLKVYCGTLAFIGRNSRYYYGIQAVGVGILNTIIPCFYRGSSVGMGIALSLISLAISLFVDGLVIYAFQAIFSYKK